MKKIIPSELAWRLIGALAIGLIAIAAVFAAKAIIG